MDNSLPQNQLPSNPSNNPNSKYLIAFGAVVILIAIWGYFLYSQKSKSFIPALFPKQAPTIASPSALLSKKPDDPIMKVGEETIFQRDLETELSAQPENTRNLDGTIISTLQKMASDSAVLQAGKTENLVMLDDTSFNSTMKDYSKRLQLVRDVKKQVSEKADGVSGSLISIWFNNNYNLGKNGVDKRKQIALEKMTKLREDIVNGSMTIEEAGEDIKNDPALKEVDLAYQVNAFTAFNSSKQPTVFFDQDINNSLLQLKPGEVSGVLLGFDKHADGKKYEAVYVVGQVKEVISTGQVKSFEKWLSNQIQSYETKYY